MLLKLFRKMVSLFSKKYWLFLILTVLVSYGQILFMKPWQEDNVPFFKVAHINEQAGYMGKGILGEGPYRHTITPYYFIYKAFGYNIPIYYTLMLLSYMFATISVYFLARNMIGEKAGRIAAFIFGCGYVASEGFFRVYTSTNISSGIGFVALLFLTYWTYYKTKKLKWLFLTIFMYWMTIQVSYVRVHYLIIPLLIFDLLFLVLPKLTNIKGFLVRSIPFLLIFNEYYIVQGDSRKSGIVQVVKAILTGKFENTYSFLGSFGNLVIPDFIQTHPVAIGVTILTLCIFLIMVFKNEKRKIFILFLSISLANIAAYSAYTPEVIYATNYRYLAHSFLAFSVILGLFSISKNKLVTYLIVILGLTFLTMNIRQQYTILNERTKKIVLFYDSLQKELPTIPKDSVIYFDIQDTDFARQMYKVSFSVAEMPETTAIAWRYGIDRYDFKMPSSYLEFANTIKDDKTPIDKIFTFWISDQGLINTTDKTREYFESKNNFQELCSNQIVTNGEVTCQRKINSVQPIEITFRLSATPVLNNYKKDENISNPVYQDSNQINKSFSYQEDKTDILKNSIYTASSIWKDRTVENIHDGDINTVWQSDRVAWGKEDTNLVIKLPYQMQIGKLYFIEGHKNNIPTEYEVEISNDGLTWKKLDNSLVKFVRMKITKTSGGDSPQIAEAWVISAEYGDMNIRDVENYLSMPFAVINNQSEFYRLIEKVKSQGKIKVYWKGNQSEKWMSEFKNNIDVTYDGKIREYRMVIPAGGTTIESFKFDGIVIPGEIIIYNVSSKPAKVETL